MVNVDISRLKAVAAKLNAVIEKSKINPKAGWVELETSEKELLFKASNYDYYFCANMPVEALEGASLHCTVSADTFIPLVAKLEEKSANLSVGPNVLLVTTGTSEYSFPLLKEAGQVKRIEEIPFIDRGAKSFTLPSKVLRSIAELNTRGVVSAEVCRDIQRYIYVDGKGAITFTDSVYLNDFSVDYGQFRFLLTVSQAKLLNILAGDGDATILLREGVSEASPLGVKVIGEGFFLVFCTQPPEKVMQFPAIRLRGLADMGSESHVILDKKSLEKALTRLMVFDKKWDASVLNYSQLEFSENALKLVSVRSKNYETLTYKSSVSPEKRVVILRFADLLQQIKLLTSKEVDISYGTSPAIVINAPEMKQLIPEIRRE